MSGEIDRTRRVAEMLRRELAVLIDTELDDPRLGMLTITSVRMSKDLKFATVYFTAMEKDIDHRVLSGILKHAASYLRKKVSSRMDLRVTPRLLFKYDISMEQGNRLHRLIDQALDDESS